METISSFCQQGQLNQHVIDSACSCSREDDGGNWIPVAVGDEHGSWREERLFGSFSLLSLLSSSSSASSRTEQEEKQNRGTKANERKRNKIARRDTDRRLIAFDRPKASVRTPPSNVPRNSPNISVALTNATVIWTRSIPSCSRISANGGIHVVAANIPSNAIDIDTLTRPKSSGIKNAGPTSNKSSERRIAPDTNKNRRFEGLIRSVHAPIVGEKIEYVRAPRASIKPHCNHVTDQRQEKYNRLHVDDTRSATLNPKCGNEERRHTSNAL